MTKTTVCTYCDQQAFGNGCVDPPLCSKHLVIANVVARIEEWGWTLTVQAVQNFIHFHGIQGVFLDEVPALCAPMPEFQEEADVPTD